MRGLSVLWLTIFVSVILIEIENKFHELTWAERGRLALGARSDVPNNFRWAMFRQTDGGVGSQRGIMDRYINIKPWNHNRVRLKVAENEFDYVNASKITLESVRDPSLPPLRYIAMQGPTTPSFAHVWRMIAEQTSSPAVIIQLTSMVEGGVVKCNQYFPDRHHHASSTSPSASCTPTAAAATTTTTMTMPSSPNEPWYLNDENHWNDDWRAHLSYESCEELADGAIEKRKLLLHVHGEDEPRTIWHFLYTRWPDFGVPTLSDMESFFELMDLSREHGDPAQPRIIHCSAGVGRTGTFICLEHLMRELDAGATLGGHNPTTAAPAAAAAADDDADLIFNTVDHLRQLRRSMVQSETQYKFLYQVMRSLWQAKHGLVALDGHAADGREPAPKRLEVADEFSSDDASSNDHEHL